MWKYQLKCQVGWCIYIDIYRSSVRYWKTMRCANGGSIVQDRPISFDLSWNAHYDEYDKYCIRWKCQSTNPKKTMFARIKNHPTIRSIRTMKSISTLDQVFLIIDTSRIHKYINKSNKLTMNIIYLFWVHIMLFLFNIILPCSAYVYLVNIVDIYYLLGIRTLSIHY